MDTNALFQATLGLRSPWEVESIQFEPAASTGRGEVEIRLTFARGSRFGCPECGEPCPAYDTTEQRWRHLDFFQHKAFLVAPVPRTNCEKHGVRTIVVPWVRDGSGFTLYFEAFVMQLVPELPVAALARIVGEHDTRLRRILMWHVRDARERVDMAAVKELVVDETAKARGHDYVSIFLEPGGDPSEPARVLFVAEGRKSEVFEAFCSDLRVHGGDPVKIRDVCMDMSESFQKGAAEHLPDAEVTFDRFHVVKLVGEAVDEVRRLERATQPELKSTRYTWLKNPENLSATQFEHLVRLSTLNLKTTKAYQMRLNLQEVWNQPSATTARRVLREWCGWVHRAARATKGAAKSGLESMARVATTIRSKMRGILNYFRRRRTSAVLEGLNSAVQAARARARGYRNSETFIAMIYLIAGRLRFTLPALTHCL